MNPSDVADVSSPVAITPDVVNQLINQPWYQSSQGPVVSKTLTSIAALVLPVIQNLFHISTGIQWVDSLIDVGCIIGFGGYALYRSIITRKVYQAVLGTVAKQVNKLGGVAGNL